MSSAAPPMKPWKVWLWVIPLAILVGVWALPRLAHAPAEEHEEEHEEAVVVALTPADVVTVAAERVPERIHATGTLEPLPSGRATLAAEVPGRLQDLSLKPGDRVAIGQVLGKVLRMDLDAQRQQADAAVAAARRDVSALEEQGVLRTGTLETQVRQATAEREAAQARLARLRAGNRAEEIERAEAQLATVEADLERLRNGPRPQEIRQAEASLRQADAEVLVATRAQARLATLVEKGVAAAKDRERADADLARALELQAGVREALALLRQGTRREEISAQEAKVRDARANLKLLRQGSRPEEISEASALLAQAEAKLAQAAAQRKEAAVLAAQAAAARERLRQAEAGAKTARALQRQAVVRSPISGTVAAVLATNGEVLQPGAPIAQLESQDALRLLLQVPAAQQARLRPGLPVTVTLPHDPATRFQGRLRVVDPRANPETGTVAAEVWFANRDRRLRSGLVVAGEIRTQGGTALPVIPVRSVFAMQGEQYVYRLDEGDHKIHQERVTLGSEHGEKVQVLEGLHPGQRILRDGQRSLADESLFTGVSGGEPEEPAGAGGNATE